MTTPVDLSQCETEPIHIPGSIQPHGVLVGLSEPDLRIEVASQNAQRVLRWPTEPRGRRLGTLLDADTMRQIAEAQQRDGRGSHPIPVRLEDGRRVHGILHRSDGLLILEIELIEIDPSRLTLAFPRLVRTLTRLRQAENIPHVSDVACLEVQALTGFERVMVYRFDHRADGEVIAEHRADEALEPFLGLRYPASDIPPQARRLYEANSIRLIVDAAYQPVPIAPAINPLTGGPIDLTHAVLRSVSPIHCEYLRNMGVRASMSISLLAGDRLWGLVACHHRTPLLVPYEVRLVGELVAQVLSARVSELERVETLARKTESFAIQTKLIDQMVSAPRFQDGLKGQPYQLADLLDSEGAAIVYQGEVTRIKNAPDDESIRAISAALDDRFEGQIVATECLSEIVPEAAAHVDRAAGAIAVPVSPNLTDRIFWFRGEHRRSVTWGGDPAKPALAPAQGERLSPRKSFEAWTEEVRGRSLPWADWEIEVASDFRTALAASIIHQAAELERLNAQLLVESQHKDHFLAAVSHDLRNPLNAILGWVRIARLDVGRAELDRALEAIERSASAQNQLIADLLDLSRVRSGRLQLEREPVSLGRIVRQSLDSVEPSLRAKSIRITTMLGDDTDVVADAGRLQQVVWNLLTNAIKFSPERSTITVRVARQGSAVVLEVGDEGAGIAPTLLPHVFEPFRQAEDTERHGGLGLGLSIVRSIVELHGGTVGASSEGEGRGAVFTVTLPVAAISSSVELSPVGRTIAGIDLQGVRVLVVDDQDDTAGMVSTLLTRHNATALTASSGREALERLRASDAVDLLVTDIELPEMTGLALMKAMRADDSLAKIPAIALTAHNTARDRAQTASAGFRHHIAKPVDPDELIATVGSVLRRLP